MPIPHIAILLKQPRPIMRPIIKPVMRPIICEIRLVKFFISETQTFCCNAQSCPNKGKYDDDDDDDDDDDSLHMWFAACARHYKNTVRDSLAPPFWRSRLGAAWHSVYTVHHKIR